MQTENPMSTPQDKARAPITHELKCHPGPFQAVKDGTKPFEWRKDDRDYRVGDKLHLREWGPREEDATLGRFTGDELTCAVTYIIREGFGIPEGYCIMGLSREQSPDIVERVMKVVDEHKVWIASSLYVPEQREIDNNLRARLTSLFKPQP
jgi:ParB family chromosome partitioning protein